MDLEILAYLGAALMIVLAYVAYRYWHATATYARRMRELHAHQAMGPLMGTAPMAAAGSATDVEAPEDDTAGPAPADASPEAVETAGESEPEVAEKRAPAPGDEVDAPAPQPTSGTVKIEPEPVEEELHDESTGDHEADQPVEDAGGAIPETFSDPGSAEIEPTPAPGDESGREAPGSPGDDATDEQPAENESETGPGSIEPNNGEASTDLKPEYRLIEELEPRKRSSRTVEAAGSFAKLLKELDEQLDALPSGIGLIDLPILERRRVAQRREELLSDRARLLEQKKRGAHRRRKRSRTKS